MIKRWNPFTRRLLCPGLWTGGAPPWTCSHWTTWHSPGTPGMTWSHGGSHVTACNASYLPSDTPSWFRTRQTGPWSLRMCRPGKLGSGTEIFLPLGQCFILHSFIRGLSSGTLVNISAHWRPSPSSPSWFIFRLTVSSFQNFLADRTKYSNYS